MRICHYPGRAIDASLSLDQQNPMETIYKNNWLNADKTIRTISKNSKLQLPYGCGYVSSSSNGHQHQNGVMIQTNGSPSSMSSSSDDEKRRNSISSLGNYQMTLDQMRKLDLEQPSEMFQKTFRNLNGYRPSVLRQKKEPKYTEWDEVYVENGDGRSDVAHGKSIGQPGSDFTSDARNNDAYGYGNHTVRMIPKIKRSQTVRYATPNDNRRSHANSVDIKNLFNRNESGKIDGQAHYPTATINKNFNRFQRSNLSTIQRTFNAMQPEANGEGDGSRSKRDSFSANGNGFENGRMRAYTNGEANDQNGQVGSKAINGDFNYSTMSYYDYENQSKKSEPSNIKIPGGTKANGKSLLRAKSVRINCTPYEDVIFDKLNAELNGEKGKCDKLAISTPAIELSRDASKKSILTNVQPLPRLTPILKQKANVIQRNNKQVLSPPTHDQVFNHNGGTWHDQFVVPPVQPSPIQSAQSLSPPLPPPPPPPTQQLRKTSSSSSLSSATSKNCECNSNVSDFSIPRPRLIVPVHTYARKRRTGNLIQSSNNGNDIDNNCNDAVVVVQPRNSSIAYQQPAIRRNGKNSAEHSVKMLRTIVSVFQFLFFVQTKSKKKINPGEWPLLPSMLPVDFVIPINYFIGKKKLIILLKCKKRKYMFVANRQPPH